MAAVGGAGQTLVGQELLYELLESRPVVLEDLARDRASDLHHALIALAVLRYALHGGDLQRALEVIASPRDNALRNGRGAGATRSHDAGDEDGDRTTPTVIGIPRLPRSSTADAASARIRVLQDRNLDELATDGVGHDRMASLMERGQPLRGTRGAHLSLARIARWRSSRFFLTWSAVFRSSTPGALGSCLSIP